MWKKLYSTKHPNPLRARKSKLKGPRNRRNTTKSFGHGILNADSETLVIWINPRNIFILNIKSPLIWHFFFSWLVGTRFGAVHSSPRCPPLSLDPPALRNGSSKWTIAGLVVLPRPVGRYNIPHVTKIHTIASTESMATSM